MSNTNQPPVDRIHFAGIHASIWRNHNKQNVPYYSVTFEKRYEDPDEGWRPSKSLLRDDLLPAAKALELAFERIVQLQADDKAAAKAAQEASNSQ